jgi:hypothetical protein
MDEAAKREFEDFMSLIRSNVEVLKPNFGLIFWQLAAAQEQLSAEDFANEAVQFQLNDEADEVVGAFIAGYIKAWLSAKDFNAASRMIANALGMSADELLQTRQIYLDSWQD